MKSLGAYGIGHGIVDIQVRLDEVSFGKLKLDRGSSGLFPDDHATKVIDSIGAQEPLISNGGSISNSLYLFSQLGGKSAFGGRTANDFFGKLFREELDRVGIERGQRITQEGLTGSSLVLITPDGERTMCTSLGVSKDLNIEDVNREHVCRASWLLVEGYLLSNGEHTVEALHETIQAAHASGTKVAFSVSDASIARNFPKRVLDIARNSDLIFANQKEGEALTGITDIDGCFQALKELTPNVVLTLGSAGSLIRFRNSEFRAKAAPCQLVDTTGAWDSFAGAFIYGIHNGYTPEATSIAAARIASRVISQFGARLPDRTAEFEVSSSPR